VLLPLGHHPDAKFEDVFDTDRSAGLCRSHAAVQTEGGRWWCLVVVRSIGMRRYWWVNART
jgi:hypothetical protein